MVSEIRRVEGLKGAKKSLEKFLSEELQICTSYFLRSTDFIYFPLKKNLCTGTVCIKQEYYMYIFFVHCICKQEYYMYIFFVHCICKQEYYMYIFFVHYICKQEYYIVLLFTYIHVLVCALC
jgi:hypothetical protein